MDGRLEAAVLYYGLPLAFGLRERFADVLRTAGEDTGSLDTVYLRSAKKRH